MWTAYSPSTPETPERINTCLLISKPANRSPTPAAIEAVLWIHDAAADTTTEQPSGAADPSLLRVQDLMVQPARQGVDISLRSLQLWADLARPCGLTALGSSATAAYDLFEKLLAAQREVVDELVAAQRQFAQGLLHASTTVGDGLRGP